MLYWLTVFSDGGDFFNLFRYITFRAGGAFFTALVFGFLFGRPLINLLRARQRFGQPKQQLRRHVPIFVVNLCKRMTLHLKAAHTKEESNGFLYSTLRTKECSISRVTSCCFDILVTRTTNYLDFLSL